MAKFCQNCGSEVKEGAFVCLNCGAQVGTPAQSVNPANADPTAKSKLTAGLLGIFLGVWGVHNFYLGNKGKAVGQLLLGTIGACIGVGPAVSGIWGLVEGIMILTGSINTDATGKPLKD